MTCAKCGRPAWKSHGGMGGGIMPDTETNCVHKDGRDCRIARAGFLAGIARGVELAKEHVGLRVLDSRAIGLRSVHVDVEYDWSAVDEAAAKEGGSDD